MFILPLVLFNNLDCAHALLLCLKQQSVIIYGCANTQHNLSNYVGFDPLWLFEEELTHTKRLETMSSPFEAAMELLLWCCVGVDLNDVTSIASEGERQLNRHSFVKNVLKKTTLGPTKFWIDVD